MYAVKDHEPLVIKEAGRASHFYASFILCSKLDPGEKESMANLHSTYATLIFILLTDKRPRVKARVREQKRQH